MCKPLFLYRSSPELWRHRKRRKGFALGLHLGCCSSYLFGSWSIYHVRRVWVIWACSTQILFLEERWFQRDATAAPSAYGNVTEETKPSSSQWCMEENKEICWTEIRWKRGWEGVWMYGEEERYTMRTVTHWNWLPHEVEKLVFAGLQRADKALSSLDWIQTWPCFEQEVGVETSSSPLLPEQIYILF